MRQEPIGGASRTRSPGLLRRGADRSSRNLAHNKRHDRQHARHNRPIDPTRRTADPADSASGAARDLREPNAGRQGGELHRVVPLLLGTGGSRGRRTALLRVGQPVQVRRIAAVDRRARFGAAWSGRTRRRARNIRRPCRRRSSRRRRVRRRPERVWRLRRRRRHPEGVPRGQMRRREARRPRRVECRRRCSCCGESVAICCR